MSYMINQTLISFLNNLAKVEIDFSNERVMSREIATKANNKIKQYITSNIIISDIRLRQSLDLEIM